MRSSFIALFGTLAVAALFVSDTPASAKLDHRPVRLWRFNDVQRGVGPRGATMRLNLSESVVKAINGNGAAPLPTECPVGRECHAISGSDRFAARAYAESAGGDFFRTEGVVFIHGYQGHWKIDAGPLPSALVRLWHNEHFDIDADADDDFIGRHAERARGEPNFNAPPVTAAAPAVCPLGPAPGAGTLQLSRSDYVTDGSVGNSFVLLTRTGGTQGAVSASVITSDGSAEASSDYTAVSTTVRFEDGDSSPRLVEIPILQDDLVEPDEAFDVSLLDPNCVAFGDQTTAEVTIGGVSDEPGSGSDVAIDPDGKAVAAVDAANGGSLALARALP
jgi:hypothetical protein